METPLKGRLGDKSARSEAAIEFGEKLNSIDRNDLRHYGAGDRLSRRVIAPRERAL
jgi:hypothetical protein